MLTLSPAYDICPQGRTGNEASQAMLIKGDNRMSTLANCLATAPDFLLTDNEALDIIKKQIVTIAGEWDSKINPDRLLAKVFIGDMIKLRDIADEAPILDHSRLLKAMEIAIVASVSTT